MSRHPLADLTADDHSRGDPHGALTIVEYGDYDCPHTRAAQAVVDRLVRDNPDVRIVFRHFPLRHLHPNADLLARVAEAAARQGRFWPMHDRMMSHRAGASERSLADDAEHAGVDLAIVRADAESDAVRARVERDVESGKASGVHSTPSFFFDGVLHDGHYDDETLAAKLAEARARKRG